MRLSQDFAAAAELFELAAAQGDAVAQANRKKQKTERLKRKTF
jgi:hypothetical protein